MLAQLETRGRVVATMRATRPHGKHPLLADERPAQPRATESLGTARPDFVMRQQPQPELGAGPVVWGNEIRGDGVVQFRTGRSGASLVAEWPGWAWLTCDSAGKQSHLTTRPGMSRLSVAKLRSFVRALLADLTGGLGLHAAAVALGSKAVVLIGESGAGKSTAAAELCMRHDARLLADDAATMEWRRTTVRVLPSETRHYLSNESSEALGVRCRPVQSDKAAVRAPRVATQSYPLALVVALRFDDSLADPVSRTLTGAEAAARILGAMFRFDVDDRRQELDKVMRVYKQARVIDLVRPRGKPSVVPDILRELGGRNGL
jgi:hypothetical protein